MFVLCCGFLRSSGGPLGVLWGPSGAPLEAPGGSEITPTWILPDLNEIVRRRSIWTRKYRGRWLLGRWHASKMKGPTTKVRPASQKLTAPCKVRSTDEELHWPPVTDVHAEVQETPSNDEHVVSFLPVFCKTNQTNYLSLNNHKQYSH